MNGRAALLVAAVAAAACGGRPQPAQLDVNHDACAYCRMVVSDARFASQIVAGHEDPRFFDDLGCLANYLKHNDLPAGAAVFVADHQTRAWIPAESAVYTQAVGVTAPMGSSILAHASAENRAADAAAAGGRAVTLDQVFPRGLPRKAR
jgi:copper chaperone NosL